MGQKYSTYGKSELYFAQKNRSGNILRAPRALMSLLVLSHCVFSSRLPVPQESTYISGAKIAHRLSFEIACCVMS